MNDGGRLRSAARDESRDGRGHRVVAVSFVVLVAAVLAVHVAARAGGADSSRCERFEAASVLRAQAVTGSGSRVVVIGDSYAAGLGLDDPTASWPVQLDGTVHVAGFSGSGFSALASGCGPAVSFAARAAAAVRAAGDGSEVGPALVVVVEGGLNDHDQPSRAIRAGFDRLMTALDGHRVVVVGPPSAPARLAGVPRVDRLLADLSAEHGVEYVATSGWTLDYLSDGLHLTPEGHRTFGDLVDDAIHG
ncbi:SGNH/GDSL hydrolase family protein [Nocardioides sp. GCM10027113]|uniref:SGNH/GDSL hydrolase family protein n=1 Tax=unclassified Nocardioides TaxID=2615069 RepID=UPI00360D5537